MSKREPLPGLVFDAAVKSIIKRDFFPNLSGDADTSIEPYPTLNSFLATCENKEDAEFIQKIEREHQMLRSAAPTVRDSSSAARSALFYEPEPIAKLALPSGERRRQPRISYGQTRFGDPSHRARQDIQSYRPFSSDASATESESEFEGRTMLRRSLLSGASFLRARQDTLVRRRQESELTEKGKALLHSLDQV
jgi:hypothetical protein